MVTFPLVLLIQAAAPAPDPAETWVRIVSDPCREARSNQRAGDEITVCGSRGGDSRYRVPSLPDTGEMRLPRAEVELADGVQAALGIGSATLPNGMVDKRVMITFRFRF
jgi:hypothetical protein